MTEDFARRLQILEDLEAIRTLKYRYANALDTSRWDDVANCFSENAVADENGGAKLDHGSGGEVLLRAA